MESLRKYIGYAFFTLVLVAAAVGLIAYVTDIVKVFKGVNDFDSFMQLAFSYLTRIVCWTIILITSIIALTKLNKMDGAQRDNKGVSFVLIIAICEFIAALGLIIVYVKLTQVKAIPNTTWVAAVLSLIVFIADIVRKVSFAKNVLVNKIMCAALALLMFVLYILFMNGLGGLLMVTFVLWLLALAGLIANPFLSSPLKE